MIRLNKYIADSGYCSRREADTYIEQGRVTVNGRDVTMGTTVEPTDRVQVDGENIKGGANLKRRIYIALNKPVGVTSTTDLADPTNIVSYVGHRERIFPIGRLDKLSQGLILLTNDGDIVNKVLRAGNAHQKEYIVTVNKPITDEFLERMARGVKLDDGVVTLPCTIFRQSATTFRIFLVQGLNRQIRRMCLALNYHVDKLERVRIMNISLKGIASGKWRELTSGEVEQMLALVEQSDGSSEATPDPIRVHKAPRQKTELHTIGREPQKRPSAFSQYRKRGKSNTK